MPVETDVAAKAIVAASIEDGGPYGPSKKISKIIT